MNHKYSVGNTVMVYQDPITKKDKEGVAQIVATRNIDHYYDVVFVDDPGEVFGRFIY